MRVCDTIAAVSTPRGKGGVALLRISGADAIAISERVFEPFNGKKLSEAAPRLSLYGGIFAPDENGKREQVDDGLAVVFKAPASFTGEDTVEICCHGGILLTQTVLASCLAAGARPAEAGEFTRRAVLNGKMALSSAEALGNLLEASNREQLVLAHTGMGGVLNRKSLEIYEKLRLVLASVYARIDYPDEDLADLSREDTERELSFCFDALNRLCETYRTGHAVAEGIRTVIVGVPNVGKSSIYNKLVGYDAAIVTDVAGTTRDVLSETCGLGKVTLRLFDTAGLRKTDNPVEKIGVERAEEALENAELVLYVLDATERQPRDLNMETKLRNHPGSVVVLRNKCDAGQATEIEVPDFAKAMISVSAKTGMGFDRLTETVETLFTDGKLDLHEDAVLTNARQYAAVLGAKEAVERALNALRGGLPIELCCTDAESAMSSLSELDGREISEEIVSEIFSHFCVGK